MHLSAILGALPCKREQNGDASKHTFCISMFSCLRVGNICEGLNGPTSLQRKHIEIPVKSLYSFKRISNDAITCLSVVVHGLQKHVTMMGDDLDNFMKSRFIEGLGEIHRTWRIVESIVSVTLDGMLHGDTTIEYNVSER